jgi:hypothetical protein
MHHLLSLYMMCHSQTFALVLLLYIEPQKNSTKENYTKHEQQGDCTFAIPSTK